MYFSPCKSTSFYYHGGLKKRLGVLLEPSLPNSYFSLQIYIKHRAGRNFSISQFPVASMAEAASNCSDVLGYRMLSETEIETPLPEIIVFGPPNVFKKYSVEFSQRFRILKPWESLIPLEEFLSVHAQNTRAAICHAGFQMNSNIFRLLPSLRLLLTTSAGLNHIDLHHCRKNRVSIAYAPTIFSADVADLAVGLLLDVMRKISASNHYLKSRRWPAEGEYPLGTKLGGKRVGIVGLGRIGLEVAKRLEAFNCKISYQSRQKKNRQEVAASYTFHGDVLELASHSDILIICCALNDQTHHLINRQVLLALGKRGIIVNVGRGAIIDEKELVQCLQEGDIAGAGLDVFENEPCVPEELLGLDNVVLSPHAAVYTKESFRDLYELLIGNLDAFFSNKPLITPVPDL